MTHVYPDDIVLEKLDHLGIATLVMGTPISTIMVCASSIVALLTLESCKYTRSMFHYT